ncbi:MAG: hypothetical protein JNL57_01920 [Bacteroidetes bacterium]|nr:hypothetical protein [Bacteroidota bacterium]
MKPTETIEKYLQGKLLPGEKLILETEFLANPPLREAAGQWKMALQALQTGELQRDISHAAWQWKMRRFLSIAGLCCALLIVSLFTWKWNQPTSGNTVKKGEISGVTVVKDSTIKEPKSAMADPSFRPAEPAIPAAHYTARPAAEIISQKPLNMQPENEIRTHTALPASTLNTPMDGAEFQGFQAWADRDTVLQCKGGLKLLIPAGLCAGSEGQPVHGLIQYRVKEYLNYYDMLKDDITTISNKELLQSGGSCFIEASQNNRELKVAAGKHYTLQFPAIETDHRMIAFYGERDSTGLLNWLTGKETNRPDTQTRMPSFPETAGFTDERCERIVFVPEIKDCPDPKTMEVYLRQFNNMSPRIKRKLMQDSQTLHLKFHTTLGGQLSGFDYISTKKKFKNADRAVMRYRNKLDTVTLKNVQSPGQFMVHLKPVIQYTGSPFITATVKDTMAEKINQIVANQFNYINCDFFKSGPKVNMRISGVDNAEKVYIFYSNFRAVMRAIVYEEIAQAAGCAAQEPALIVAFRNEKGQQQMSITRTNTQHSVQVSAWELLNTGVLKKMLETDMKLL